MVWDTERNKSYRKAGTLSGIPTALAGGIALGYFGGSFVDSWLGTDPWLSCLGALFGIVAGGRVALQLIKLANRED